MALEPITRQEKIIAGQDLTPITRMEKFLKQYGGGSGGVTSWNDLTDKPFGEVTTVKEVLAEQELVFAEQNGLYAAQLNYEDLDAFSVGARIKVLFDGVEYALTVESQSEVIYGGNAGLTGIGVDTGEPFVIGLVVPTQSAMVITSSAEPAHTVAIYEEVTEVKQISGKYVEGMGYEEDGVVHPIDPKFLPSGGGGGAVYYVGWSDDVGGWVLYKDENYSVGVTIEDFDSVLSAKAFRTDEEYVGFGGAFLGNEGGFALRLFVVNDNNSVVYIETKSADYKAGGPV